MYTPPAMGYDRATTIFSPDGKLYQVEYAFEAVKRGLTAIGVRVPEGVILAVEKRIVKKLQDPESLEKIQVVDDHIAIAFAGFAADGRVLIEMAREYAQLHRLIYDEPIDVLTLVRYICDIKQAYTQHGGVRPFGVSLLVGGIDKSGPKLYMTQPDGMYIGYYAYAIGSGAASAIDTLEKEYSRDMSLDDAIVLALKALKAGMSSEFVPENIEVGVIDVKTKKFRKLSMDELKKYVSKVS